MKNIKLKKITLALAFLGLSLAPVSCINDLKQEPITDVTSAGLYKDFRQDFVGFRIAKNE